MVRHKLRLSVDRIDVRIRQLREEIDGLEAEDAKQAAKVDEVNQVMGAMKRVMEEECKKVLDREDQRRGGVIGETYEKLNELLEVKRSSIVNAQSQTSYCDEVDKMGQRWEAKTREDCRYLEGRMEKLRAHLKQVEEALARSEINGMISANIVRAGGEPPTGMPELRLSLVDIDEELIKS